MAHRLGTVPQHRFAHGGLATSEDYLSASTIAFSSQTASFWFENIAVLLIFFLATLLLGVVLGIWYQKLSTLFTPTNSNAKSTSTVSSTVVEDSEASIRSAPLHAAPMSSSVSSSSASLPHPYRTITTSALSAVQHFFQGKPPVHTDLSISSSSSGLSNNASQPSLKSLFRRIPNYHPPKHIAVIMDGNRRFGKRRHADALQGHWAGGQTLVDFIQWCIAADISIATVYAFSTENWQRDPVEVTALMSIFIKYAETIAKEAHNHGICIKMLATDKSKLPVKVQQVMDSLERETAVYDIVDGHNNNSSSVSNNSSTSSSNGSSSSSGNSSGTDSAGASPSRRKGVFRLNLCISYGGRGDLVQAMRQLGREVQSGTIVDVDRDINEQRIAQALCTGGCPDPEVLLRTSGELRLSNFLLWQLAYTECFFLDKLWPELTVDDLFDVLRQYHARKRRFGT